MRLTVKKWGNSLGIRLPKVLSEQAKIYEGSYVEISVVEGKLLIDPIDEGLSLNELLSNVNSGNIHPIVISKPKEIL